MNELLQDVTTVSGEKINALIMLNPDFPEMVIKKTAGKPFNNHKFTPPPYREKIMVIQSGD